MNAMGTIKKKNKSIRGSSKHESKIASPLRSLEDEDQPVRQKALHTDSKKFLIEKKIEDGNGTPLDGTPIRFKANVKASASKKPSVHEKKGIKKDRPQK